MVQTHMLENTEKDILWKIPDPILGIDSEYNVAYMNQACETMLDVSFEKIKGMKIQEKHFEIKQEATVLMSIFKMQASPIIKDRNKEKVKEEIRERIRDPLIPKKPLGVIRNSRTITIKRRNYIYDRFEVNGKENKKNISLVRFCEVSPESVFNEQFILAERMSGLGTLGAGIAHEFNNPLYSMIGFSEMILKENEKEAIDIHAKRIKEKAQALVKIIEKLNSYISSPTSEGHPVINLNERMDAALEVALLTHESEYVQVEKDYCSLPLIKSRGDDIQQIFFNIISNSLEAMRGGGKLKIKSECRDKTILVSIQDTGEGMPEEFINRVFDPFFTTKAPGKGTGLGLTAVYQLVKKTEGNISIASQKNKGTTVQIIWPIEKGEESFD